MATSRFIISTLLLGLVLLGCSSRQPFVNAQSSQPTGWWQCDPKSEREWRCSDGQSIEETSDPIGSNQVSENTRDPVINTLEPEAEIVVEPEQSLSIDQDQESETMQELFVEPEATVNVESSLPEESQPIQINSGQWIVQFAAFATEAEAIKFSERFANTQIDPKEVNGRLWYRVISGGFSTKKAAQMVAEQFEIEFPGLQTWVRTRD